MCVFQGDIYEIYITIMETSVDEKQIAKMCEQVVHNSLKDWFYTPEFVSDAHTPLLQRFQRLLELKESQQMLIEIHSASQLVFVFHYVKHVDKFSFFLFFKTLLS